jgi:hypothetical protein
MTKVQIFKNKKIDLEKLYRFIKRKFIEDDFVLTSEVQTEYVYHLRAEKTGVARIVIGGVRDVELIIAGEPNGFALVFSVGAWGKNIVTSGATGYIVASLASGPAVAYGGFAAAGSYLTALGYEQDVWKEYQNYIDLLVNEKKTEGEKGGATASF